MSLKISRKGLGNEVHTNSSNSTNRSLSAGCSDVRNGFSRNLIIAPNNSLVSKQTQNLTKPNFSRTFDAKNVCMNASQGQVQLLKTQTTTNTQRLHYTSKNSIVSKQFQTGTHSNASELKDSLISMDEVLQDLCVLEEQQRESQRQLATITLNKKRKLEERSQWNDKLSSLQFMNGASKQGLDRARQILSHSTRQLGEARLRGDAYHENLRLFDSRLKKVITNIRSLQDKRRKAFSVIIDIRKSFSIITRKKMELHELLHAAVSEFDEVGRQEKVIAQKAQDSTMKIRSIVDDNGNIRSILSDLELDLNCSQQMEVSTKARVQAIETEIQGEQRRHSGALKPIEQKLMEIKTLHNDFQLKVDELNEEKKIKEAELKTLLESVESQIIGEQNNCNLPYADMSITILNMNGLKADVDRLKIELECEREAIQQAERITVEFSVNTSSLEDKCNAALSEAKVLQESVRRQEETEILRDMKNHDFLNSVQTEHKKVSVLRDSLQTLEELYQTQKLKYTEADSLASKVANEEELCLQKIGKDLIAAEETLDEARVAFREQKDKMDEENKEATDKLNRCRIEFENLQSKFDVLNGPFSVDSEPDIVDFVNQTEVFIQTTNEEIAEKIKAHPCLESINVSFDSIISYSENVEAKLYGLRSACDAKVKAAEKKTMVEVQKSKVQIDDVSDCEFQNPYKWSRNKLENAHNTSHLNQQPKHTSDADRKYGSDKEPKRFNFNAEDTIQNQGLEEMILTKMNKSEDVRITKVVDSVPVRNRDKVIPKKPSHSNRKENKDNHMDRYAAASHVELPSHEKTNHPLGAPKKKVIDCSTFREEKMTNSEYLANPCVLPSLNIQLGTSRKAYATPSQARHIVASMEDKSHKRDSISISRSRRKKHIPNEKERKIKSFVEDFSFM